MWSQSELETRCLPPGNHCICFCDQKVSAQLLAIGCWMCFFFFLFLLLLITRRLQEGPNLVAPVICLEKQLFAFKILLYPAWHSCFFFPFTFSSYDWTGSIKLIQVPFHYAAQHSWQRTLLHVEPPIEKLQLAFELYSRKKITGGISDVPALMCSIAHMPSQSSQ